MPGNFASDYMLVRSVMQSPKVRAKLAEIAAKGAPMANARAQAERIDARATVTHGTRPRGRPYSRIQMPGASEFGSSNVPRRRVLGQIAAALRSR